MKKIILTLSLIGSFINASDIKISDLKWTQDYEMLVNLNSGVESTLEGLDQNKNGIRDDIEYYVLSKYEDKPFQKEMFLEAASKIQEILNLPKEDKKAHVKLDKELLDIYTCRDYMLYKLNSKTIKEDLKDKTIFKSKVLNTNKRLQAYIEHKKILPFKYEKLDNETLDKERIACQQKYKELTSPDMVSFK